MGLLAPRSGQGALQSSLPSWLRLRPFRRRATLAPVITVLLLFFLYTSGDFVLWPLGRPKGPAGHVQSAAHGKRSSCPAHPPDPIYSPGPNNRFDWAAIEPKFPVESLRVLQVPEATRLPRIQHDFKHANPLSRGEDRVRVERQAAVKRSFMRCWTSYKRLAWGHDELAPVTGGAKTKFGGFGATLIDSLDTLLVRPP
jgi:mannosyl-oligosaccharide alpha-1,2-mannosidase